jgi:hypothetical protein
VSNKVDRKSSVERAWHCQVEYLTEYIGDAVDGSRQLPPRGEAILEYDMYKLIKIAGSMYVERPIIRLTPGYVRMVPNHHSKLT